jgi:hypothetical protein
VPIEEHQSLGARREQAAEQRAAVAAENESEAVARDRVLADGLPVGVRLISLTSNDPRKPYLSGEQYVHNPDYLAPKLAERVRNDVRTLCTALGYDINTVEFAIKDNIPYAIDFMNPAPDAELASVGEFYHKWITEAVVNLVFKRLGEQKEQTKYRWNSLLSPQPTQAYAVAATEQQSTTTTPQPEASASLKKTNGPATKRAPAKRKKS